jgi:head-tail adaptor
MKIGMLDSILRIERPLADTSLDGAGSGEWVPVAEAVWASVQDVLPSRGEREQGGFSMAARPSRVRMHWRDDISSDMRFVDVTMGYDARVMQIISGPATIGRREAIELMVEDYTSAGNGA